MVSMKLETFEFVGKTENRARLFFKKACWKNGSIFCIRCRSRKIYRLAGKRYRCKNCKYTFHDFSGRWIGKLRIPFKKWLWIIKFFEVELSARKISQQVGLSYPTVHKAITIIRLAILASIDQEFFLTAKSKWMNPTSGAAERVSEAVVPQERFPSSVFSRETVW